MVILIWQARSFKSEKCSRNVLLFNFALKDSKGVIDWSYLHALWLLLEFLKHFTDLFLVGDVR